MVLALCSAMQVRSETGVHCFKKNCETLPSLLICLSLFHKNYKSIVPGHCWVSEQLIWNGLIRQG